MYTHVCIHDLYGFRAYILTYSNLRRLYIRISLISSSSLPATRRTTAPWSFLSIVRRRPDRPLGYPVPKNSRLSARTALCMPEAPADGVHQEPAGGYAHGMNRDGGSPDSATPAGDTKSRETICSPALFQEAKSRRLCYRPAGFFFTFTNSMTSFSASASRAL
jgi:hypothetical protein